MGPKPRNPRTWKLGTEKLHSGRLPHSPAASRGLRERFGLSGPCNARPHIRAAMVGVGFQWYGILNYRKEPFKP